MKIVRARNELIIERVKVKLFRLEKYFRKFKALHEERKIKANKALLFYVRRMQFHMFR
jgi:hypothetical protein